MYFIDWSPRDLPLQRFIVAGSRDRFNRAGYETITLEELITEMGKPRQRYRRFRTIIASTLNAFLQFFSARRVFLLFFFLLSLRESASQSWQNDERRKGHRCHRKQRVSETEGTLLLRQRG